MKDRDACGALGRRGRTVGVPIAGFVGMPGVGVPEDRLFGDAEGVECAPDGGGGRFTPRSWARGQASVTADAGNVPAVEQSLAGEGDAGDFAALIAGGFADQDVTGLAGKMRGEAV